MADLVDIAGSGSETAEAAVGVAAAESSQRNPRRPNWRTALGVTVGIGFMVGVGALMSMQSPLSIAAITIEGASADLQPQVAAALGAAVGDSFGSVDTGGASDRIVAIDGIDGAEISWTWWNTLVVAVDEQTPAAVVVSPAGFNVVDATGSVIRTVAARPAALPLIESGDDASREVALALATQIPPELIGQVDAVIAEGTRSVTLRLTSGATAFLGAPTDLEAKFRVIGQLSAVGASQLNVSVPGRPAVKGLPAPPKP